MDNDDERVSGGGFYITIPRDLVRDTTISSGAKLCFGIIANLSNQRGYCFASNKYIADELGEHKDTVSRHISSLIKFGWLISFDHITDSGKQRRLRLSESGDQSLVKSRKKILKSDGTPRQKIMTPTAKDHDPLDLSPTIINKGEITKMKEGVSVFSDFLKSHTITTFSGEVYGWATHISEISNSLKLSEPVAKASLFEFLNYMDDIKYLKGADRADVYSRYKSWLGKNSRLSDISYTDKWELEWNQTVNQAKSKINGTKNY